MKEIIGLIPVKGMSDRVLEKNTRKFANTSLLELKLEQISKATGFEKIIVSSESHHILGIARSMGFETHERDPKFSTSDVPMSSVYSYVASEIGGDHIAWINITNPLADTCCYTKAAELYQNLDGDYDCLLSVTKAQNYFFHEGKPVNFVPKPWPRSQDLDGTYEMSFVINILRNVDMVNWGSCVGNKPYFFVLDRLSSWDIDFQEDFDFCEMIFDSKNKKN
ncbi:hypothetical protein OAW18_05760 [Alphaproteobacteria bacterium]|nr:hypothetical protein [Alphaproteobacteria bacterium]